MNIIIAGVGGQGTLLTSKVLGKYAELIGQDCKLSEIHGMSQRGGSVTTHVRIGEKIHSPVVWAGGADMIIAFEVLEAARIQHYLKEGGILLVNDEKILPLPCVTGLSSYPDDLKKKLLEKHNGAHFVNAVGIATEAGSEKATNIVMLGCLCGLFDFDRDKMKEAISACVPEKFRELNITAFDKGYASVR